MSEEGRDLRCLAGMGAAWRWPQWEVLRSAASPCLLTGQERPAVGFGS